MSNLTARAFEIFFLYTFVFLLNYNIFEYPIQVEVIFKGNEITF